MLKWVLSFALTFAVAALIEYWMGDQSIGALQWLGILIIAAMIRFFFWSIDQCLPDKEA
jgi:hypothetical protein